MSGERQPTVQGYEVAARASAGLLVATIVLSGVSAGATGHVPEQHAIVTEAEGQMPDAFNFVDSGVINLPGVPYAWYQNRPDDLQPPPALVQEFADDLAGDNCQPIAPEAAAATYQELYETKSYDEMTNDELLSQVSSLIEQFEQLRSKLDFINLPDNYDELYEDAMLATPQLPIAAYQTAMGDMLQQAGVNAVYDWTPALTAEQAAASGVPGPSTNSDGQAVLVAPLPADSWDSWQARSGLLNMMRDIAVTPKKEIADSQLPVIYFGTNPGAAAVVVSSGDGKPAFMQVDPLSYTPTVVAHELGHATYHLFNCEGPDVAWLRTNPAGFAYGGEATGDAMPGDRYTSLEARRNDYPDASGGEVAAFTDYGTTSIDEDWAEEVSRIMVPDKSWQLFVPEAGEAVRQKSVLYIERQANRDPDLANFYKGRLGLVRLREQFVQRYGEAHSDYYEKYYAPIAARSDNGDIVNPEDKAFMNYGPRLGTKAYAERDRVNALNVGLVRLQDALSLSD